MVQIITILYWIFLLLFSYLLELRVNSITIHSDTYFLKIVQKYLSLTKKLIFLKLSFQYILSLLGKNCMPSFNIHQIGL